MNVPPEAQQITGVVYSAFHEDFPLSCEIGYKDAKEFGTQIEHQPCQCIF